MNDKIRRPDRLIFPSIRLCYGAWDREGTLKPRVRDRGGVLLVEKGQATLSINGRLHRIEAGDQFWIAPGTEYGCQWEEGFRCSLLLLACRQMKRFGRQWLAVEAKLPSSRPLDPEDTELNLFPEIVIGTENATSSRSRLENQQALHRWMIALMNKSSMIAEPNRPLPFSIDKTSGIEAVLDYIAAHYARELSVSEMAALVGISVNHFIRLFKSETGLTPTQYVLNLRMKKARQLLFSTDKIKTVARSVGYRDEHYFSRAFKKAEGVAPAFYMQSPERRIAVVYYGLDDYLQTLGISPVAAVSSYREPIQQVHSRNTKSDTVWLDGRDLSYAALRRTEPDLILTSSQLEADERLEQIAPTVTIPYTQDLPRQLRKIAEILDRKEAAEHWINRYTETGILLRQRLAKHLGQRTACYIRVGATFCRVYGKINQTGALLYEDLGLELPSNFPSGEWAVTISQEQLSEFDADYLFVAVEPTPEAAGRMNAIADSPQWRSLQAVQNDRVYDAADLLLETLGPSGRLQAMNKIFDWMMLRS
ncbi:helix-turn-helix domain-containing protein [Saccharibacillus sp. JS10]|uniref:helix-turn-helix domain-containing protein n=1 Tax=Saccharibacillus sp. JS10 TaxID=2950552 RepID=UPI00210AB487|nr:helix-turn-helix domain-containing protein [Saccharibacillus sp. JS10]MCQ4086335.1 ABC transporter substrate-binding protein [Saccharibacillus sp. JS10]